jgi:uncharacterized membrane protein YqaE (UPF0057 family)
MKKLLPLFILTAILVSCGTSNNVVQDGLFQKRKYTSGWFVKKNKGIKKKSIQEESLALEDTKQREYPSHTKSESTNNDKVLEATSTVIKDKNTAPENSVVQAKHNTQKKKSKSVSHDRKKNDRVTTRDAKDNSNTGVETFGKEETPSAVKESLKDSNSSSSDAAMILLIILCFLLPPLAVWLATSDTTQLIISIILTLLFWLPGIIHALLVVFGLI